MGQFSPGQIAKLNDLYAHAGENSVPGLWLADGTVAFSKTIAGAFSTGAQGTKGVTAYGWGNHALAGYATGAQGAKADTAYSWGDHALAGYLTTHRVLKHEKQTSAAGELTLTGTPAAGSELQVFQAGALIDPAHPWTFNPATNKITGLADGDTIVYYLE